MRMMPTVPVVVGMGKYKIRNWSIWGYRNRKLRFIELPLRSELALCRPILGGSERHRYAIAWPHKLGTIIARWRMAVLMETVAESGKGGLSPVSKHQIQPGCGE